MIIDYIENLSTENIDNIHALNYMKTGLFTLANTMQKYEEKIKNDPLMDGCVFSAIDIWPEEDLRISIYMWFTNTIVNYVQLVWTLSILNIKWWTIEDIKPNKVEIKKYTTEYVNRIIPDILFWRNKVFAHFSITDPYDADNLWLLQHSVSNPLSWNWNNYVIWDIMWWVGEDVASLPKWALTSKYEELKVRYWPDLIFNK